MLSNIGASEIILVMIVALILFGPNKLPEIGRSAGKMIREFKTATKNMTSEFSDLADLKSDFKDLKKDLTTLPVDRKVPQTRNVEKATTVEKAVEVETSVADGANTAVTQEEEQPEPRV